MGRGIQVRLPWSPQNLQHHRLRYTALKAEEYVSGGRLLRKAFKILSDEITEASLDFVQDICLNVVGALVRQNELKLGIQMLEHCAGLFEKNPAQQHQYHLFSALSSIIGQMNLNRLTTFVNSLNITSLSWCSSGAGAPEAPYKHSAGITV